LCCPFGRQILAAGIGGVVLGFFVTPLLERGRSHRDPRHALGFYGGLGDLLATATLGSWDWPTRSGSRSLWIAGKRRFSAVGTSPDAAVLERSP
jgi:hypothetical protein